MCGGRLIIRSLVVFSVVEVVFGVSSVLLGVFGAARQHQASNRTILADTAPIWSGVCFLVSGMCGVLCAKKRSGLIMIVFSTCCICGLISGILNIQFARMASRQLAGLSAMRLASMAVAGLGTAGCVLLTWLTCRLASSEQQRLFLERDVSLHHSHQLPDKDLAERSSVLQIPCDEFHDEIHDSSPPPPPPLSYTVKESVN